MDFDYRKMASYVEKMLDKAYSAVVEAVNYQVAPAYVISNGQAVSGGNLLEERLLQHGSNFGKKSKAQLKGGWKDHSGKKKTNGKGSSKKNGKKK